MYKNSFWRAVIMQKHVFGVTPTIFIDFSTPQPS